MFSINIFDGSNYRKKQYSTAEIYCKSCSTKEAFTQSFFKSKSWENVFGVVVTVSNNIITRVWTSSLQSIVCMELNKDYDIKCIVNQIIHAFFYIFSKSAFRQYCDTKFEIHLNKLPSSMFLYTWTKVGSSLIFYTFCLFIGFSVFQLRFKMLAMYRTRLWKVTSNFRLCHNENLSTWWKLSG